MFVCSSRVGEMKNFNYILHKMSISQKECSETLYWLELLYATDYLEEKAYLSIHSEADELYKIITSIILTKKKNMKKQP